MFTLPQNGVELLEFPVSPTFRFNLKMSRRLSVRKAIDFFNVCD